MVTPGAGPTVRRINERVSKSRALGVAGEDQAAAWYTAQGYEVLDRNWRCSTGEIDLILSRRRQLVFCEVKTRSSDRFGVPAEAVTPRKQARLRSLAAQWLQHQGPLRTTSMRFDVAAILNGQLDVLEGAF